MPTESPSALQSALVDCNIVLAEATGDYQRSLDLALGTARLARIAGNRWAVGHSILNAAFAATRVLNPRELLRLFADAMPEWRQANDLGRLGGSLAYVAHGLADLGDDELAAKLLGAETRHSISAINPRYQELRDELGADIRQRIWDARFEALRSEGNGTSMRSLADEALQRIDHHLST